MFKFIIFLVMSLSVIVESVLCNEFKKVKIEGIEVEVQPGEIPAKNVKVISVPMVQVEEKGVKISFGLDKFSDVTVSIIDKSGKVIRHLVSGVLGDEPPELFKPKSLQQIVYWDKLDDFGKPVPSGKYTVKLDVGGETKFDKFLGFQPGTPKSGILSLATNPLGELVVASSRPLDTNDPYSSLYLDVYTHEGKYLRTVAPYNPAKLSLKNQQKIVKLLQIPSGQIVPLNALGSGYNGFNYLLYWTSGRFKPIAVLSDGTVITTHASNPSKEEDRLIVFNASGIMQKNLPQLNISKPIILGTDKEDNLYISAGDRRDAIYKVKFKSDGFERLMEIEIKDEIEKLIDSNTKAVPVNVVSVAVDDKGEIFAALEGGKVRRYTKDGKFLSENKLPVNRVGFSGLRSADKYLYCLGEKGGGIFVCKVDPSSFKLVWGYKVGNAPELWAPNPLAVSRDKESTLIYVGGFGGSRIIRIVDEGNKPGEVSDLYGFGHLVAPSHLVVDLEKDLLFAIDLCKARIVKMKASDGSNFEEWQACTGRRGTVCKNISIDRIRRRVMVGYCGANGYRKIGIPAIKWEKGNGIKGIFPFDYNGKFIPLDGQKDSQGSIPNSFYSAVDREGNIFATRMVGINVKEKLKLEGDGYANPDLAKRLNPEDLRGPIELAEYYKSSMLWSLIDKYSPDGAMIKAGFITPYQAKAGIEVDSKGFVYTLDLGWVLAKYAPGGVFGKEGEVWHRRGMISGTFVLHCGCGPRAQVCADEFDRIFATDAALHNIKVFDTAGNLVMCIGGYGTQEFQGPNSAFPEPEIALCLPSGIAASKDYIFISDTGNSRIVKCKIVYADTKQTSFTLNRSLRK